MKASLFFCMILTVSVHAETFTGKIHSIEDGMIKFENGRVAFLDNKKVDLAPHEVVEVSVDEKSSLMNFNKKYFHTPPAMNFMNDNDSVLSTPPVFESTIVQGMDEAWNIFNRSNPNWKRISECSDRAHIWAHDEFKLTGTKSKKVFVFFTASYINSVRFKWWFHVAPLYTVNDRGTIKELVMDYRYTSRPMTVKEWTDEFVYTKRACKVTTRFSEYDVNPQTENCYVIIESMHYKIPADIQDQETYGKYKTLTTESELKAVKNLAFQL